MKSICRFAACLWSIAAVLVASLAHGQGRLETPRLQGSAGTNTYAIESGKGMVSGWHCDAQSVQVSFDSGAPLETAYGTPRPDTLGVCGDTDNGFGLLYNFNTLGPGVHTIIARADGVPFAQGQFEVMTFDEEFVRNADGASEAALVKLATPVGEIYDAFLKWDQSKQNFVIVEVEKSDISVLDLLAAVSGSWVGDWVSASGGGSLSLEVEPDAELNLAFSSFVMTGTGCAAQMASATPISYPNIPSLEVTLTDGSRIDLDLTATESVTLIGGAFVFVSGPCDGLDGLFILSPN